MRKLSLIIALFLLAMPVHAATYYWRSDGGNKTECNGLADKAKNSTKVCAWNSNSIEVKSSTTLTDTFKITKGDFTVSIKPPSVWISMTQFMANPKMYTDMVVSGRTVNIQNYNGRTFTIVAK